jgi:ABC-2 type transport system ATP-binding protein
MIDARGVSRRYGRMTVLADLDLSVERGRVTGLLGANGAGKTTAMRILAGVLAPTRGRVTIDGIDASSSPLRARALVGYLPEDNPLPATQRVVDLLEFTAAVRGMSRAERTRRIARIVEQLDLGSSLGWRISSMSKGTRQRVGLAQAVLHDPRVLIRDEPTNGLDPVQIAQVRALVRELAADRAVLISSHRFDDVRSMCDGIHILSAGRTVFAGSIADSAAADASLEQTFLAAVSQRRPHARELVDCTA